MLRNEAQEIVNKFKELYTAYPLLHLIVIKNIVFYF